MKYSIALTVALTLILCSAHVGWTKEKCQRTGAIQQIVYNAPPTTGDCDQNDEGASGSRGAPKKNKSTAEKIRNATGWVLVGGTLGAFAFGVGAVVLTAPVTVPLLVGGAVIGGIVGGFGSVIHDSR